MKIPIIIKVIGPGQCIANEMQIIEKALRDAGYKDLIVKDEFPSDNLTHTGPAVGFDYTLIAQHCPWGG